MAFIHSPKIVTDGLVFHIDTMNTKSYVSGSTNTNNLGTSRITSSIVAPTVSVPGTRGNPINTAANAGSGVELQLLNNFPEVNFTRADNFTMCVWASVDRTENLRGVFARGSYGGFVGIYAGGTGVAVGTRVTNGSTAVVDLTSTLRTGSNGEIFNAVMVYKSSSMDGYLNGQYIGSVSVLLGESTFTEGIPPSYGINAYGGIGGNAGPATMSFYNASIYNRALSAAEIKQNYEVMRVRLGV